MTCQRLFEAEAMRDGRLGETERAGFERHLTTCTFCADEVKALDSLGAALKTSDREDELHVRRERMRVLAAFDRDLMTPVPPRRWPFLLGAVAAASILAFFFATRRTSVVPLPAAPTPIAHTAAVEPDAVAVWSRAMEEHRERVTLSRGALRIQVRQGESPVIVVLPDGELEDLGTTFSVSAEDGHTSRVTVEEGTVILRLRGESPITIAAGTSWTPPVPTPSPGPTVATRPVMPKPIVSSSAAEFRAAMTLLNDGQNTEAANAFATFSKAHSDDPRAEDAAYMRVIALRRSGDVRGMKSAAHEYLTTYPAGFRRAEVDTLLDQ